jgi:hypothetical protein
MSTPLTGHEKPRVVDSSMRFRSVLALLVSTGWTFSATSSISAAQLASGAALTGVVAEAWRRSRSTTPTNGVAVGGSGARLNNNNNNSSSSSSSYFGAAGGALSEGNGTGGVSWRWLGALPAQARQQLPVSAAAARAPKAAISPFDAPGGQHRRGQQTFKDRYGACSWWIEPRRSNNPFGSGAIGGHQQQQQQQEEEQEERRERRASAAAGRFPSSSSSGGGDRAAPLAAPLAQLRGRWERMQQSLQDRRSSPPSSSSSSSSSSPRALQVQMVGFGTARTTGTAIRALSARLDPSLRRLEACDSYVECAKDLQQQQQQQQQSAASASTLTRPPSSSSSSSSSAAAAAPDVFFPVLVDMSQGTACSPRAIPVAAGFLRRYSKLFSSVHIVGTGPAIDAARACIFLARLKRFRVFPSFEELRKFERAQEEQERQRQRQRRHARKKLPLLTAFSFTWGAEAPAGSGAALARAR